MIYILEIYGIVRLDCLKIIFLLMGMESENEKKKKIIKTTFSNNNGAENNETIHNIDAW